MDRKILHSFQIVLAFAILFTTGCSALFPEDTRPNFLIIVTDDQRFDTMQYMPQTQQLIFDQGVTFSRGYVTTPFCCPSRATILTGMYAHNHNVHINTDKLNVRTVVEDLHENGYYTGLVGKYLNSWNGESRPEFDYWVSFFGGTVPNYYDPNLNVNGTWEKHTGYITYLFKDYAKEYLDRATSQRKPFFLLFAPNAPHAPYTPLREDKGLYTDLEPFRPPNYNEADVSDKPTSISKNSSLTEEDATYLYNTRQRQILTLVSLDRAIGEIITKLAETGELDNTVIVFLSDNGTHWGEHRMTAKNTVYEESVKVPFALRYPALVPTPYLEAGLVANIDIAPTIYELSNTPMPETVDGLSLVSLLRGDAAWRSEILLEAWPDRGHWSAIHTGDTVYVETDNDLAEFYDLTVDPYQLENQINNPEHQAAITRLKEILQIKLLSATAP